MGGVGATKNQGDCLKKGGLGPFADLGDRWEGDRGGLAKKMGIVFLKGHDTPRHTVINWYC